jgi:hypothetical protein
MKPIITGCHAECRAFKFFCSGIVLNVSMLSVMAPCPYFQILSSGASLYSELLILPRLERLARGKHSSLFLPYVSDKEKNNFVNIKPDHHPAKEPDNTFCLLPAACCLLPAARCPLPTAHCPLPTC